MEYSGGGRREEEEWKSGEDTAGMGRLYECVFCKRGFTTAQALGGHMNIHRKDRAKTNTSTTRPPRAGHELAGAASPAAKNGGVSYPPASHHLRGCFNLFHGQEGTCYAAAGRVPVDCGWNLSLQVGPSSSRDDDDDGNVYNHEEDRRRGSFVGGEELDLELRLGHGRT